MAEQYTLTKGRPYIHKRCGKVTVVTGADFSGLCNPSQVCLGTICANCGGPDSVSAFYWQDTEEPLHEYRRRLRKSAPAVYHLWRRISPLIGLCGGAALGFFFLDRNPPIDITVGSALGVFVMWLIIGPAVANAFGTKFYEQR